MPKEKIILESPIEPSFRVASVCGTFDMPPSKSARFEIDVNLPIESEDWQIGLVVGPSGSGKTTIGRRLFPGAYFHCGYDWPADASLLDGFPSGASCREITESLSSVGFSSPPHWLKRFSHLSNGQQFRCELARLILESRDVVVDEFTSIVDRDAARIGSAAVAKMLRRRKRPRFVALSCHYDVIDWLDPDWIFDTGSGEFARRLLRRRPPIELQIHAADRRAWRLFSQHHYLTAEIAKGARCFVATWNGKPVAFASYVHFPHPSAKNIKRAHRIVTLPDFQGVGIGNTVSEWLGGRLKAQGFRYRVVTSNPAIICHCRRSPKWRITRCGAVSAHSGRQSRPQSDFRFAAGCEYIGPAN